MSDKTADEKSASDLRSEAEKRLSSLEGMSCGGDAADFQKVVHELRVHQIELEMQNAQLAMSQAELEKSRKRYSDLFDFAPVGYLSFDEDGLILEANLTIATMLGAERKWMKNSSFQKYVLKGDRDTFRLHLQKVSKTKVRDKCELRLTARNGNEFYAQLDSLCVEESDEKIFCHTSVIDITERKMAAESLQEARDELEKRVVERTKELVRVNEVLQDFASIASHDLREPLRKITAFGSMLKAKFGDSIGEQGYDYTERMISAAKRMDAFLLALLDYSRVSVAANSSTPVDLTAVVNKVLSDLEILIARTKGRVEVGNLPTLEADSNQMWQLFQNLIGNGLKFHRDEPPIIKVSGQKLNDGQYEIFVEDNGIGFDEKYLDRIFAPFQRLQGRSKFEGTGMGLTICKKIVERHGGSITAKSKPGEGATFIVRLPMRQRDGREFIDHLKDEGDSPIQENTQTQPDSS